LGFALARIWTLALSLSLMATPPAGARRELFGAAPSPLRLDAARNAAQTAMDTKVATLVVHDSAKAIL
jgi:hypothetical protein